MATTRVGPCVHLGMPARCDARGRPTYCPTSPRPRPGRGAPSGVSSAGGTGAQFVVGVEDGEAAVVVAGGPPARMRVPTSMPGMALRPRKTRDMAPVSSSMTHSSVAVPARAGRQGADAPFDLGATPRDLADRHRAVGPARRPPDGPPADRGAMGAGRGTVAIAATVAVRRSGRLLGLGAGDEVERDRRRWRGSRDTARRWSPRSGRGGCGARGRCTCGRATGR